ncbi:MAG: hypothetical protein WCW56_02125 [Candidatus Paceibacterota bacterium]|jgi:heme exporter protein D
MLYVSTFVLLFFFACRLFLDARYDIVHRIWQYKDPLWLQLINQRSFTALAVIENLLAVYIWLAYKNLTMVPVAGLMFFGVIHLVNLRYHTDQQRRRELREKWRKTLLLK